jgi:transcriptional regulator with XRE-family HTH domain
MQAFSINIFEPDYVADMQIGRPSKHPRTPFGERLLAARVAAGLSQAQVADKLGITQTSYADWERHPVALRPDQVEQLTKILKVTAEELYGSPAKSRGGGPVGKARRLFEEVSKLPRDRQRHVLHVVEDLLKANRPETANA